MHSGGVGYTLAGPGVLSSRHTSGSTVFSEVSDRLGPEGGVQGYSGNKDDYLSRLRRIEGQIRGLQRMIEEDKYCIDILTQVALGLLDEHLSHCVTQAAAEGGEAATVKVREASDAIARLVRS